MRTANEQHDDINPGSFSYIEWADPHDFILQTIDDRLKQFGLEVVIFDDRKYGIWFKIERLPGCPES